MAFPTTSVLSSFTGSDEDPLSEGGAWSGPVLNGGRLVERLSNMAAHSNNPDATNAASMYWNATQYGPDIEVYASVPTYVASATRSVAVWGRIHNPGNATTMEAYIGAYTNGVGWRLFKVTSGSTFTQIGSTTASPALVSGDKIGLEVIGTSLKLYHFTGGSWVERCSGTDSAITGAGFIGVEFGIGNTDSRMDDFGGGTVVTIQKVNLLRDLLENPVAIDAALWVQDPNGGSITPTSTGVVLVTPTTTNVVSVNSLDFWDAIASRCFIELADPGADTKMALSLRIDANNYVAVDQDGADLIAVKCVGGTQTSLATITYNPSTMKFWSIREAGGTTFWEYSANGLTWTLLHSVASPIDLSAIKPRFSAWSESGISETAKFRRLNFPGSQVAVPTTDSVDGSWTDQAGGTSLFAAIDETVPSDSDYIRSPVGPSNSGCRVKLATLADPTSSDDHRIHWRTGKDFVGGPQINMTVKLYQGGGDSLGAGTLIATFARNNVGQALTTFVESLSGAEADAITNYADLYLEFFANQV